ncbi:MAG TPA: hypothetical protein VGD35_19335 [Chitinophaga sp.]
MLGKLTTDQIDAVLSETAGLDEMHKALEQKHEPEHHPRPVVYRIRINEKSGRYEKT